MKKSLIDLLKFVAISCLCGVLIAAMFLPGVFGLSKGAKDVQNFWAAIPGELVAEPLPQVSTILDSQGNVIGTFYSENRINISYADIPPVMKNSIIAVEDSRFYQHGAVDSKGLGRAMMSFFGGGEAQGGSTLTQQYVKNVLLNNADTEEAKKAATEQTLKRKIQEMKLASEIEKKLTKDQILTNYLNIANFGDGSYGIGAASLHYFGVPVQQLSLPQAATLAGLVKNPSGYDPVTHPDEAKQRRNVVLLRMQQTGYITEAEKEEAQASPLDLKVTVQANGCLKSPYPFYCQMVRNTLASDETFGATEESRQKLLYRGGLVIKTALDPRIQGIVTKAATDALGPNNQFATSLAVVQPGTGKVVGIGTNRNFGDGDGATEVNYATSGFQNGSTFKPITLMTALENGWTIDQKINTGFTYCAPPPEQGCFNNMYQSQDGNIDSVRALAISSNTFFTQLSATIGTEKVQSMARRLGVNIPSTATGKETSTTLGVYNITPIQLANVYATIAAHGVSCDPTWITEVSLGQQQLKVPQSNCHQEVSPDIADQTAKALTQVIDGPDADRAGKDMSLGRPAMGKTGTTNENSAVWFTGGTPQYQMSVWMGDPRGGFQYPVINPVIYGKTVQAVFGSTASGPIWKDAMSKILDGVPVQDFTSPSTMASNRQAIVAPNLIGLSPQAALTVIKRAGLKPTLNPQQASPNPLYDKNIVVGQSISPGSPLNGATEIQIQLSAGSDPVVLE